MRMTIDGARVVIVAFSLLISGALLVFLALSPVFHVPFTPGKQQNLHLIEIILPVFLGYIGSATHFLFNSTAGGVRERVADERLLALLVYGPFGIFTVFNVALFYAFCKLNQEGSDGMSYDDLSQWFSIGLGVLTCSISVISSYIFGKVAAVDMSSVRAAP